MSGKRRLAVVLAALLGGAVAGGLAYGTITGSDTVYSACVLRGVGQLRLIDKSLPSTNPLSHCLDKESEISWNQAGPPGPKGEQGEPGRGLGSLDDLAGIPCRTPDLQGVVEISSAPLSAKSASVVVRCTIPNTAILTVTVEDLDQSIQSASGRVTGGPVDCEVPQALKQRETCVYVVPLGAVLTLTATPLSPDVGYVSSFAAWLTPNECSATTGPCTLTVNGDLTVVAQFSARPAT